MVRWATDGAGRQMGNAFLKNLVGFEADGILEILGFQEFIDVREAKAAVYLKYMYLFQLITAQT